MANCLKLPTPAKAVVVLLITFILALELLQAEARHDATTANNDNVTSDSDPGDPWATPLQELHAITNSCSMKISTFHEIASDAQRQWQSCIDEISPRFPELESRTSREEDSKLNASVIQEIDKRLHMAICRNTTAYKSCWSSLIAAINLCEPGAGDLSQTIYYALYDDICRDGGRITIENRRLAASAGMACTRDYVTDECMKNKGLRSANDLCIRFESNVACDLSSIDPTCSNTVDKRLHADIFKRVQKTLGCNLSSSPAFQTPEEAMGGDGSGATLMTPILPFYLSVYVLRFIF